jgi:hypothetical protein
MKIATKLKLGVAALMLSGGMAMAALNTEAVVAGLQADGYTWIEVKRGPTQVKIEAVRGTEKIETIYDRATGVVIEREVEVADGDDLGRTGVQIRDRSRDFTDGRGRGDDDDDRGRDDDDDDRGRDDDDDDRGRDDDDDDRGRDDRDDDRGRDDDDNGRDDD